ncbi:hypothetical protein KAR91_69835 [Candidatus Pacearchaeota archaeon]|nr:hypothetical protein [Candidatus Pacearchaeota archaeon]
MSVYTEIKKKSYPIIEEYRNDLINIDKEWITDNPGVPFLHYTRNWGTHMIVLGPAEGYPKMGELVPYLFGQAGRDHILRQKMESAVYFDKNEKIELIQYYDGETVKTIDKKQALEIVRVYSDKIHKEFWRMK